MDYQCLIRVSKQQRKLHSIDGKYTFFHWVWTPKCITGPTIWDQLIQVIVFADTDGYGGFFDVSGNKFSAAHQDRIMEVIDNPGTEENFVLAEDNVFSSVSSPTFSRGDCSGNEYVCHKKEQQERGYGFSTEQIGTMAAIEVDQPDNATDSYVHKFTIFKRIFKTLIEGVDRLQFHSFTTGSSKRRTSFRNLCLFFLLWMSFYVGVTIADPFSFSLSQDNTQYVYTYTSCGVRLDFHSLVVLKDVKVLVVGGGGGGGSAWSGNNNYEGAGGGGAGRMQLLSFDRLQFGSVLVGCGGEGTPGNAQNGGLSKFQSNDPYFWVSVPGGGGGAYVNNNGKAGGSSGGATGWHDQSSDPCIGSTSIDSTKQWWYDFIFLWLRINMQSYGNIGGNAGSKSPGGGGGGAGAAGGNGKDCKPQGGAGRAWDVTGAAYAGGGSGGLGKEDKCNLNNQDTPGGVGGGGAGGHVAAAGSDGAANTGGGGGGGGRNGGNGGHGGSGVVAIAFTCPPGYTADTAGRSFCKLCSDGYIVSTAGVSPCEACPAGTFASSDHKSCIPCADGTFSANPGDSQGSCGKCAPGKYAPSDHIMCQSCLPGSFCTASDTCQGQCNLCGENTFCEDYGCVTCSSCASITSVYTPPGATGCGCPADMSATSVSLLSLLIQSDRTLRSYTQNYTTASAYDVQYSITQMLNVELDENGDGDITRDETIQAMTYRSLKSSVITQSSIPLWRFGSTIYQEIVRVSDLHDNMLTNYHGPMQSFDGSGIGILASITTDYPSSSWSASDCDRYDAYNNPNYQAISVNWKYTAPVDTLKASTGLKQVCAYVNGEIVQEYASQGSQNPSITHFVGDKKSNDLSYKRVYCIVVTFLNSSSQYACTVGLYYDGTPIDLSPKLTTDGVVFSYFDTSSFETEFDIFSGAKGSPDDSKIFVVGIPYASKGCGRVSTHIAFTDKTVVNSVGMEVEYSVRSIQKGIDFSGSTDTVYRIPFLSTIIGTVRTKTGVGVFNVTITVCHINPITAVNDDYYTSYCPLFYNLTTDPRGHFESEIRISDPEWTRLEEHFNVSASYTEYLSLDSSGTIVHVFEPPYQIVAMRQLYPSQLQFIDTTAVSIFGSVKIDPSNTDGKDCVFPGVPVHLVHGNGNMDNTTSASDGSFNFSVSIGETAYVYIPDYRGYTWDSFVRSAVVRTSNATVTAPPTSAPIVVPSYIATSEWPQDTGTGTGLYDFNWIHTSTVVAAVATEINFPGRIFPGFNIGPPKSPTNTVGWYYFQTTFSLPDYADYACLSIPLIVQGGSANQVQVTLNNRLLLGWTLGHLQSDNTLIVGVQNSQPTAVRVSVRFSAPTKQCPKTMPISTGVSGGSTDYNWMVASSTSFPVNGSLDFGSVLSTTGDTATSKFIRSKEDLSSPGNYFAYQTAFTLPGYRNYSCIHLPIYLSVLNYNVENITINDVQISIEALAVLSLNQTHESLAPYLQASNILKLTVRKVVTAVQSGLSVEFGDVRINECVEPWPQSTGISLFKSLDNNWRIRQNSTSPIQQAVSVSYVLSTWIPGSNRTKWIGLAENAYERIDKADNYTFETHFQLANEVNFPCLQIQFNLSASCQLVEIVLNSRSLYNCSAPSNCGVTSYKQTSLLLSKYLQSHNVLQIVVFNSGNVPTGILVTFASKALSTQCFTETPISTGQGIAGDLDNNWIAINDAGLQTTPVVVSSFSYGANWISASIKGPTIYQTSFKLPAFVDFRSIKLPIMIGVGPGLFVSKITVNGQPSFDTPQYSLSNFNFTSSFFPLALEYLATSNIVEFYVRSNLPISSSRSAPLLVTFGDPITDDFTPWPKSTGTSHLTSVVFRSVPVGFDSFSSPKRRLSSSQASPVFTIQIRNYFIRIAEFQLFNQGVQLPRTSLQFHLSSTSNNVSNCFDGDLNTYCSTDRSDQNSSLTVTSAVVFDTIVVDCGFNVSLYVSMAIIGVTLPSGSSNSTFTFYSSFQSNIGNQFVFNVDLSNHEILNMRGYPTTAPTAFPTRYETYLIQIKNDFIVFSEVQLFSQGSQLQRDSLQFSLSSSNAQNCNDGDLNTYCSADTFDPNPTLTIATSTVFDTVVVECGNNILLYNSSGATIEVRFSNTTFNTSFRVNNGNHFIFFIPASRLEIINVGGFPSIEPTFSQTLIPSLTPTRAPRIPTVAPSALPTRVPSYNPTEAPTYVLTSRPTMSPTFVPSNQPTAKAPSFDFNWMITELIGSDNVLTPMQYPSTVKLSDSRYVLTPPTMQNVVGLFNFHTTFHILDYANDSCLQIPFDVSGTDSFSYIRLNGQSVFYCQLTTCNDLQLKLSGLELSNSLDIGVDSKGVDGASLSVIFSLPTSQCILKNPHSTSGSIRLDTPSPVLHSSSILDRDYAWMITAAPDTRQVSYFAFLLQAVPVGWYIPLTNNGWITSTNSASDTMGSYTFAIAFTLSFYSNFSCVKLPIGIAATDSIVMIRLNGYSLSLNISSISTSELHEFQLRTFHLQEKNLLEIMFETETQAPALYVEFGQLLFDTCISLWPQSTGRNEYSTGSLDENWQVSATLGSGKALPLQEAVVVDSISSNWFADKAFVCATAADGGVAVVRCPASYMIDSIVFASYGTPAGSCGNFEYSSCNAFNSMSVVSMKCMGLQSCNVSASHSIFQGDSCYNATKHLTIEVSCLQKHKWIGLTRNISSSTDATGFYNFQTYFSIPGPNTTFADLIIPMAIACANSLNYIKLNGETLYDCEKDQNCNVSASRLAVFLLRQHFQSNNLLEIVTEIGQDAAALGLLVEFRPMIPLGTGDTNYNFDLAWLLVSAPYFLDYPKPSSVVYNPPSKWFHFFSSVQRPKTTLTTVPSSNSRRRVLHTTTAAAAVCLFGDCTRRACVKGTKCVYQNPYYSQCLIDPSTDRKGNCIANYGQCTGSTTTCCSYAFTCSGIPYQCNPIVECISDLLDPSSQPSLQPRRSPTDQPSKQPLRHPSIQPRNQPTDQPSRQPSLQPTDQPSRQPSIRPSKQPSRQPTKQPMFRPSKQPTSQPSMQPSDQPSWQPSKQPKSQPSKQPTSQPSMQPSYQPTSQPSKQPTSQPSCQPSKQPTNQPSRQPLSKPTLQPSLQPTIQPSKQPTSQPSKQPRNKPSRQPSTRPSLKPSLQPTSQPANLPTRQPSMLPSDQPTIQPLLFPSSQPSTQPTNLPTAQPSTIPSNEPSSTPSDSPSFQPSSLPSSQPSTFLENIRTSSSLWISSGSSSNGIDIAGYYTYQTFFYIGGFNNYSCLDLPIMISAEFQVQLVTLNGFNIYKCCSPRITSLSIETLSTFGNLTTVNSLTIKVLNQQKGPTGLLVSFGKIVDSCVIPTETSTLSTMAIASLMQPTLMPGTTPSWSPSEEPTTGPTYTFACPVGYSRWRAVCVKHSSYDIMCPQGYMFHPDNLGCIPATFSPTQEPTDVPTTYPTEEPSISPSRPTSEPTSEPTEYPSVEPTLRPSQDPTWSQQPSFYPTFEILNFISPKLLHTYKFNDLFGEGGTPAMAQLIDSTSGAYAVVPDNPLVEIVDGNAVFVNGDASLDNYLILPHDFLGPSEVITVEVWVRYEESCPSDSILFSFGDVVFTNSLLLTSPHSSLDVYIAVVYSMLTNPPSRKLYIDGQLNISVSDPTDVFYHPENCYIGKSSDMTSPGMVAKIDEFRVWSGELPEHIIHSHYLTGVDPSHITLSSFFTITDINITYFATSTQLVNVGMYGGNSQIPMFGAETEFTLTAFEAMCDYSLTYTLDPHSSSYTQAIAAMNYTVTLSTSAKEAPVFSDCGNAPQCFCDSGKPPVTYMTELGELSQDLRITEVRDSLYSIAFTYHTGVCFEAKGSEHFSLSEGPCIDPAATILQKWQNLTVNFVLFELYPEGNDWVQLFPNPVTALNDYRVDNGTVIVTDLVSHIKSPQRFSYTTQFIIVPPSLVNSSTGMNYTISAGNPLPSSPFSWSFDVRVERLDSTKNFAISGPDTPVSSAIDIVWYIPVIGIISNEVPNFYPVASDPTMIYLVLRDPPGGSSSTTFHGGKSLSFDMSVDQLETFGHFASNTDGGGGGGKENEMNIEAPLGVGITETGVAASDGVEGVSKHTQTITYARGSDSHYTVTINFSYDISTSQDPRIAGHLSDVIVGGGVDLIVSEAIQVAVNQTDTMACLFAFDTYLWQPGRATTYALPVIEIEDIISRLTRTRDDLVSNDKNPIIVKLSGDSSGTIQQLNKLLDNWNKVLSDYRAHNKDMNAAFDQEQQIVSALMNTYQTWQTSIVSNSDLSTFVKNELTPTNPISIVSGLLSGDSTGISKDLSTASTKFSELGTDTKSLSDGLATLARTASSLTILDPPAPQSLKDALTKLSDKLNSFSDKFVVVASGLSNLASNPLLKTLASIIQLTFKDLSTRFDNIFNSLIKKYVQPLINKVQEFAAAAKANLATFQNKVGDYLDTFLAALSAIDISSQILHDLFHDMASHTPTALSNILSDISTVFQDIRNVESKVAYYLNLLTQFFPTPTSTLKLSLSTMSDQFTSLAVPVTSFLNSIESITSGILDSTVIQSVHDFTGILSQVATYAMDLVPILNVIESHVSILSPLFKKSSSSSSSSSSLSASSLASSISAFMDKFSATVSKLSAQFTALATSAAASLSTFLSKMSSMCTSIKNNVNSAVTFINSLIEEFQQLISLASIIPGASDYLDPVDAKLNSFSVAINAVPEYCCNLPQLLIQVLALFDNGVFRSTLETTHDAILNVSVSALSLSASSSSFSHTLPSPFSVALSPPLQLSSQVCSQLSKVSVTLATTLSSLISTTEFAALSAVLNFTPSSKQIIELLSKMNSYIIFVAEKILEIVGVFPSQGTSNRRVLLLGSSRVESIQSTLLSLFATYEAISTEFLDELNSAIAVAQGVSDTTATILAEAKGLPPPIPQLPKTLTNTLTAMKNAFSALSSKLRSFVSVFTSLSSQLSAVNPVIVNVISNVTDLSSASGKLSSNIDTFTKYLPHPVGNNLVTPLNELSYACKEMQTYSALFASTLSYVSANPALQLITSVLTDDIVTPMSSSLTTFSLQLSPLTDNLIVLAGLFSTKSITNQLEELLLQLPSLSSSLQDYLSTIVDACGIIQKVFSKLSVSATPLSSDLGSFLSSIATTAQSFSTTASSLGASISSLLTALSSSSYIATYNLDITLLDLSSSSLNLSTSLTTLNQSMLSYFAPSLSPVLLPFSSKLDQLSVLTKSVVAVCSGPLTAGLGALSLIPEADYQLSDVMNTLASATSALSIQLKLLSQDNVFFVDTNLPLSNDAVTVAVSLVQSETNGIVSAVNNFVSFAQSLPYSQSLSPVFQKLNELLILMVQYINQINSFLQSLASPLSSLSSPVSRCLTSLANISASSQSIALTVNSESRNFSSSPYTTALPLLAENITHLSISATSVIMVLSSLSSSPDLALVSTILATEFPTLNDELTSVASSFESLSSFFTSLNTDLLPTVGNNMAFLSTLLYPFPRWLELDILADVLSTLASTFKSIAGAIYPISNSLKSDCETAASYLSLFAATSESVVLLINELRTGPTSTAAHSLSLNVNPNRIAQCALSLQQYSVSSKQFLDSNVQLLDMVKRPLYRVVSPPLEQLSTALSEGYETTSSMSNTLSMLFALSSLLPAVARGYTESFYSSFDELTMHVGTVAAKMAKLSSNMQQRSSTNSVVQLQLSEYSNDLRSTSSDIISSSGSLITIAQRLTGLSLNIHSLAIGIPILQKELLDLSRTSSQLSQDFHRIISSMNFLTSPLSYFSPAMSSLITDLTNISTIYSFNSTILSFSQQSYFLCTGLTVLSASPLLAVIPEITPTPLLTELSVQFSHTAHNVSALIALKHLLLTSDPEEEGVLVKTTNSMARTAKLLLRVSNQMNSTSGFPQELKRQASSLSSILAAVAALFQSTSKSASSLRSLLTKLPSQTRRSLGRINPATGVLFGLMEKEINMRSPMKQDVPGYTFGNQNFEGPAPEDWATFYSTLESECDLPSALDGSTPITYAAICQKRVVANSADIPGGFQSSSIDSIMGFLQDASKVLTFSANAPMSLSWSSAVSGSVAYHAQYDYTADDDEDVQETFDNDILGVEVLVEANEKFNVQPSLKVRVGKHTANQHSNVRTVSVNLGDQDNGDYFAVRITQDPVYATPIFTTLGGQSKCPGETLTSRRESRVEIIQVLSRCGPKKNQICDETTLLPGEPALFGVVIQNLSPTHDEVYYTLGLSQRFDIFHRNAYEDSGAGQCGTPFQRSGLVVSFSQQDLQRIPYNLLIEVPITVTPGQLCNKFVDVELQIVATCEIPNSNSQVFQYGVVDGDISYEAADKIYALNNTATFSVSWPAVTTSSQQGGRRSLSDSNSNSNLDYSEKNSNLVQLIRQDMKTMMFSIVFIALATILVTFTAMVLLLRYYSVAVNRRGSSCPAVESSRELSFYC